MKLNKSKTLGLWALVLLANYIAIAQPWYSLEMAPNGTTVELGRYDGFTAYSFLSPILLVSLAALFAAAFIGGLARKIAGLLALALTAFGLVVLAGKIAGSDVSGLAPQIETLTGIAATHGIKDLTVLVLPFASISLALLSLLGAAEVVFLLSERTWPKRTAKGDRYQVQQSVSEPSDTIGLWDSQR